MYGRRAADHERALIWRAIMEEMRRWAIAALCAALAGCGGAAPTRPRAQPPDATVVGERRVGPRVLDLTVRSPSLGRTTKVRLLLPDRGARPWPVLYLLHGCCDSYRSWTRSTDVEQMRAHCDRVLVVMPEGGDVGFYSDWRDGPGLGDVPRASSCRVLLRALRGGACARRSPACRWAASARWPTPPATPARFCSAAASFSGAAASTRRTPAVLHGPRRRNYAGRRGHLGRPGR